MVIDPLATPEARLRAVLTELIDTWHLNSDIARDNSRKEAIAMLDRRQRFGVHQAYEMCAQQVEAALSSLASAPADTVPVKPMKQWHNKRYAGEGVGAVGPWRVVIRTDRKTTERYIELLHDDDAGGFGFTRWQAKDLIPMLQAAVEKTASAPSAEPEQGK